MFQKDYMAAQKAKVIQEPMAFNVMWQITPEFGPANSPYLNPFVYRMRVLVEQKSSMPPYNNNDFLKSEIGHVIYGA